MDVSLSLSAKTMNVMSAFQAAQLDVSIHEHLVSRLAHHFSQSDVKSFSTNYITCLKKILVNCDDSQTGCASVALEFAVKFLIYLINEDTQKLESLSKNVFQFWNKIFDFLKKKHNIADTRIRRRVCQFVARFMLLMSPDAELDCKICEIIVDIMKERIKDRSPQVRTQAILAVYRLQDSSNPKCPVKKMLLNCIQTDSAAEVRRLAILKISLQHKPTVRLLIDKIDDKSEKVRKDVYLVFSKLHPLYFSGEERTRLLYTGFHDNCENVRHVVKNVLVPAWFKRMDNDCIKFLHLFDLLFDKKELVTLVLMSLIRTIDEEKSRETIDVFLDRTHAIPQEELTCDNAFYWRCYVFYTSGLVDEKTEYEWQIGKSFDAHAAGLLPDLSVFCEYMHEFHRSMCKGEEGEEKWKRKEQEFIFVQLIELCKTYDYADEVGRKNLQQLCLHLLPEMPVQMMKPLIQLYFNLRTNLNESISAVTNEVNNLLHPSGTQEETESATNVEEMGGISHRMSRVSLTPEQRTSLKFEIAKLEVRLEELNDVQEEAIRVQDFTQADSLKTDITALREQITSLKESFYCKPASVCYDTMRDEQGADIDDDDDEVKSVNPLENIDSNTVLRCVTILREMMNLSLIKTLTSELRALLQDFVTFACKSDNHIIAPLATELLGSFCLRDKNLAIEYFLTIFSLSGNSDICVSALRVIFDFLSLFGAETFNITNLDAVGDGEVASSERSSSSMSDVSNDDETEKDDNTISGYTFISTLINLLDDEYTEARFTVAHGLCRLMCVGKLKSPKVLSRLIILWFHPSSSEAVEIRSCLNYFFIFFVKHCKWSLPIFEEAFLPTVNILFEAPPHNPISGINKKEVIQVICAITDPNYIREKNEPCENIHPNLAVLLGKSILERDELNDVTVLLKAFDYLNLSDIQTDVSSAIDNLLQKIVKKFKKQKLTKLASDAEKFRAKLNTIVEKNRKSVSTLKDQDSVEQIIAPDANASELHER